MATQKTAAEGQLIKVEQKKRKGTKRYRQLLEKVNTQQTYTLQEALEQLKACPPAKFLESVDVAVVLGIDPRKSDQNVRGATVMPHGTGKTVKVAVFAQGAQAEAAKAAGADIVGFEDLAEQVKAGDFNFDVVIATPDAMRVVGRLGQILGPKGLMPNPKVGTVTPNVDQAVSQAKAGQVRYRNDKNGIVHSAVGKIDFPVENLMGNIQALMLDLKRLKPAASKGVYFKKLVVSTTMGIGLTIDVGSLSL